MAHSYNVEEAPPDDLPSTEHDIRRAKKFLQKHSSESGDNLYDHLTELLAKILAERPRNAVDIFEEYSRKLKEERFKTKTDHLRDVYIPPMQYDDAKKLIKLFQSIKQIDEGEQERMEDEEEDDKKKKYPNMLDLLFYFEQTGVGLPRYEMVLLNLSIRKFAYTAPLENIRFWGKILGKSKNYYVVEAELQADELAQRLEQQEAEIQARREKEEIEAETAAKLAEEEAAAKTEEAMKGITGATEILRKDAAGEKPLELVFPPLPVNPWRPPPEVPAERIGSGLNKKVYFVCNAPGLDEWIELPAVTPQQIVIARQIVRYCTGNLETPIHSFPPFPGTEKNYLRAQIARISATTHVSPIGFFTFGEEGEDEEIEEEREQVIVGGELSENIHYDPLPIKDLIDPSMSNWCHHSPFILKQGRTVWWNPEKEAEIVTERLDEEEEVEEDEIKTIEKEIGERGPPLLTPLSEDAIDFVIPWTTRPSSYIQPDIAIAFVRSNIWLGAFAFAVGKRFANMYIGWGHKYNVYNYSPPIMPPVQDQYKIGPEIMEISDPTIKQEEAYRIARLPPASQEILDEEEEEEEEEEEDEEEDEEDE